MEVFEEIGVVATANEADSISRRLQIAKMQGGWIGLVGK